ncbi:MAG: hypothetical protein II777_10800 [Clostridia bacterium]|nr:hypothetical protein [Clostridia bacterium]
MKSVTLFNAIGNTKEEYIASSEKRFGENKGAGIVANVFKAIGVAASCLLIVGFALFMWITAERMKDPVAPPAASDEATGTGETAAEQKTDRSTDKPDVDDAPSPYFESLIGRFADQKDGSLMDLNVKTDGRAEFCAALKASRLFPGAIEEARFAQITPDGFYERSGIKLFLYKDEDESVFVLSDGRVDRLCEKMFITSAVLCDVDRDGVYEILYTASYGESDLSSSVIHFDPKTREGTYVMRFTEDLAFVSEVESPGAGAYQICAGVRDGADGRITVSDKALLIVENGRLTEYHTEDETVTGISTDPPTEAVTEPPVTEPPVTEPPVTEPPVTDPPVTEPPVTEPPVTEPPAVGDGGYRLTVGSRSVPADGVVKAYNSGGSPYIELSFGAIMEELDAAVNIKSETELVIVYYGETFVFDISNGYKMTSDHYNGNWFDNKQTPTNAFYYENGGFFTDLQTVSAFLSEFGGGAARADHAKKHITVTDFDHDTAIVTTEAPPIVPKDPVLLSVKEYTVKALIYNDPDYDGKATVRISVYTETEAVNGNYVVMELIGKDGGVLDTIETHGCGFVAVATTDRFFGDYIIVHSVAVMPDKSAVGITKMYGIMSIDRADVNTDKPHFYSDVGVKNCNADITSRTSIFADHIRFFYNDTADLLTNVYETIVLRSQGEFYRIFECENDGYSFYEDKDHAIDPGFIDEVRSRRIDTWISYFR